MFTLTGKSAAAAAAVTSGHYMDNKAPRYTRLHSSRASMGITEPKGFPGGIRDG